MPRTIQEYRVFIASPGGLDDVRQAFREELRDYNEDEALWRHVIFTPVGWELTLPGRGRPQGLINKDLETCDYFLLVLGDRWGSPPDTDGQHTSGCEEEFHHAEACLEDPEQPMASMAVFFRAVDPARLADPDEQLKKVLDFKRQLEVRKTDLFGTFDDLHKFRRDLRRILAHWLRQHEQIHAPSSLPTSGDLSLDSPAAVETPGEDETTTDPLLEQAQELADQGQRTDAETLFAKAILTGDNPDAFLRYGDFLYRVGRVQQAEVMFQRVGQLAPDLGDRADYWLARSLQRLGWLAQSLGHLSEAEASHRQSLELDRKIGNMPGLARNYGNLGNIYLTRGDLEEAESLYRQSLALNEALGRKEGMAGTYGNLGLIYRTRGDLEEAESLHRQSLALEEELDRKEGMAITYGNLGPIYWTRGDLEEAESLHHQSLALFEELGSKEGMASQYEGLALIYRTRGDLEEAESLHRQSLALSEELGRKQGMAITYGNLGLIYQTRGDLEEAESLGRQALALEEALGSKEGVATQYGNLGVIYQTRGDLEKAESLHRQALALEEALGSKQGMAITLQNLGVISRDRGDFEQTRELWERSLALYEEVGMASHVETLQRLLDKLPGTEGE